MQPNQQHKQQHIRPYHLTNMYTYTIQTKKSNKMQGGKKINFFSNGGSLFRLLVCCLVGCSTDEKCINIHIWMDACMNACMKQHTKHVKEEKPENIV